MQQEMAYLQEHGICRWYRLKHVATYVVHLSVTGSLADDVVEL